MAIIVTLPPSNNITVNETAQTVNVSTAASTVSVVTAGVATTAFSALTDANATAPYTQGHFISVGSDQKLRVNNVLQAAVESARPVFEYLNSDAGTNSSIVLRKNYGATAFTAGDGAGIRFEVDSNTQPPTEYAYIQAAYSTTAPAITFASSSDDGATSNNILVANKDLVTFAGDIKVNGNTIYTSTGWRMFDYKETASTIYGTNYEITTRADKNIGMNSSFFIIDGIVNLNTSSLTTTSTATAVLDYFDKTSYRSAKYLIQISSGSDHQMWEGMMIHDGSTIKITAYGDVRTNGVNLATVSAGFNATTGYAELRVTPVSATQTKFKAMKTYFAV
jgi:hypothetical protein